MLTSAIAVTLTAIIQGISGYHFQQYQMIGGAPLKSPHLYPFIARLNTFSGGNVYQAYWGTNCVGAVISDDFILTAAHCFYYKDNRGLFKKVARVDYHLGANNIYLAKEDQIIESVSIDEVTIHEIYNVSFRKFPYDFALVKMKLPISAYSIDPEIISPIKLVSPDGCTKPGVYTEDSVSVDNCDFGTIVGWQSSYSPAGRPLPVMLGLPLLVRSYMSLCGNDFSNAKVCAGAGMRRHSCFGGSGGPLICMKKNNTNIFMIGVDSYGPPDCTLRGYPEPYAVFGRICNPRAMQWLKTHLEAAEANKKSSQNGAKRSFQTTKQTGETTTAKKKVKTSEKVASQTIIANSCCSQLNSTETWLRFLLVLLSGWMTQNT